MAEYETDFYPEHARAPEEIVEPDGTLVPAEVLLPRELAALTDGHHGAERRGAEMLTFLTSLVIMFTLVVRGRDLGQARGAPAHGRHEFDGIEEVVRVPAIIDSAPDCIIHINGAKPADDSADFILQAAYEKCAGIMTFGPGSTYGEDGTGAHGVLHGPHVDRDRRDGGGDRRLGALRGPAALGPRRAHPGARPRRAAGRPDRPARDGIARGTRSHGSPSAGGRSSSRRCKPT